MMMLQHFMQVLLKIHKNSRRKSLVIIEDVDRCVEDHSLDNKSLMNFLKSLIKLKHYNCKNRFLNKKLKSIIFIIALDENKLYDSKEDEAILKLFDFRTDLGNIHNEDYVGILDELLKNFDDLNARDIDKNDFRIILRSEKISLRLLKNIINDAMLKYNVLKNRFHNNNNIKLKSCIAYAYLKNSYYSEFNEFIKNGVNAVQTIQNELNAYYQNLPLSLDSGKERSFKKELAFLIKNNYLDDSFKLYFYNYPKIEYCPTVQEDLLKYYLLGKAELDIKSNSEVSSKFIKQMQAYINSLKLSYPKNLFEDSYLSNVLFETENDYCLINLLANSLKLDTEENIEQAIKVIQNIIDSKIKKNIFLPYLITATKTIWSLERGVYQASEKIYEFRNILFSYLQDDIVKFKQLFNSSLRPLTKKEFNYLENKKIATSLINDNFILDLEDIFLDLVSLNSNDENIKYALFWSKNVSNEKKFISYAKKTLLKLDTLDLQMLGCMKQHLKLLFFDEDFNNFLNAKFKKLSKDQVEKLNSLHLILNLNTENLEFMQSFDYGMTSLMTLLYSHQFDLIISSKFNYKSRFPNFEKSSEGLKNDIFDFQNYYLNLVSNNKLDNLFENSFLEKYPIEIDWKNVNNIHMVISKNLNEKDNIIKNLNNKELINKEKISSLMKELINLGSSYNDLIFSILEIIFTSYPDKVLECEEDCKKDIINLILAMTNECGAKLAINFQMLTQTIIEEFSNIIKNYSLEEENKIYAKFINDLSLVPTIEVLDSIIIDYPFNCSIIEKFYLSKSFSKVIKSCILSKSDRYLNESIEQININSLLKIYNEQDCFKIDLLTNSSFLKRLEENQLTNEIEDIDIISLLNKKTSIILLKFVVCKLDDERIINILNGLDHISYGQESIFINIIKYKSDLIVERQETFKHLWDIFPNNYRAVYTKKMHEKNNYKVNSL